MPSQLAHGLLFLSSYAPLLLILACQEWGSNRTLGVALALVAVGGVVGLAIILRQARATAPSLERLRSVSPLDGEVVGYLVTYLLPFLGVDLSSGMSALPFIVFIAIVGVLYVNSGMLYINPVLNIAGYHVYRIETESGQPAALVSKREFIQTGVELKITRISNYVYVE